MANFSADMINQVCQKGILVEGYDARKFCKDKCSDWIQKNKFGIVEKIGWEIDHVYLASRGDKGDIVNLRLMHL